MAGQKDRPRASSGRLLVALATVVAMAGVVAGVVLSATAAGAAPEGSRARAIRAAAVQASAPPLPTVATSGPLGVLDEPPSVINHDKGQSVLYDDGAGQRFSYWSFGDTYVDSATGSDYWVGNTAARTTDLDMGDNVSTWAYDNVDAAGDPHEAFSLPPGYSPDEYRVWGGSMAADAQRQRIVAIYHIVDTAHDSQGYGVAIWTEATDRFEAVPIANPADAARPYVLWPAGGPAFNTGMLLDGGFLYAYGCYSTFRCSLARVPLADPAAVADRAAWRFHTAAGGTGCPAASWSSDLACARPLPSAELSVQGSPQPMLGGAAGMSVAWNDHLGRFLAIYTRPVSNDVVYAVADRPEGPWSAPGLIAQGTASPAGKVNYAGYAHPEYAEEGGRVQYVTYFRNLAGVAAELRVLRVTFDPAASTYQRAATGEAYFGEAGSLRVNAAGPTAVDTSGTQASPGETTARDRHGVVYSQAAAPVGAVAVARVVSQTSVSSQALGGLAMRNSFPLAHNAFFTDGGEGYVALVAAPSGGVSLRWDADGDQDLDSVLPVTPNTAPGQQVWLRLTRLGPITYEGAWSTTSTDGVDGTWTTVGVATVPTALPTQDVGVLAAGPDGGNLNRLDVAGFRVLAA
jgi:uncharacterized protein DUF4185